MASVCNSMSCIDSVNPTRATYQNIFRWPESDKEFLKRKLENRHGDEQSLSCTTSPSSSSLSPQVVDSFSCRQVYLRSYKFTRKESMPVKTVNCFANFKNKASKNMKQKQKQKQKELKEKGHASGKSKKFCCAVRAALYHLLSCTVALDIVDGR